MVKRALTFPEAASGVGLILMAALAVRSWPAGFFLVVPLLFAIGVGGCSKGLPKSAARHELRFVDRIGNVVGIVAGIGLVCAAYLWFSDLYLFIGWFVLAAMLPALFSSLFIGVVRVYFALLALFDRVRRVK